MCPKKGRIGLNILIPMLVLIVGSAMLVWIVWQAHVDNRESVYTKAELNAVSYSNRMIADIERSVAITDTLEQIVISENGRVDSFGTIAENMFADFVQSIQLAPGGVVTEVYPAQGNEAGKIDLFGDGYRAEVSRYAKEHNKTVMQGPFTLRQGGRGIAVRNPVFLEDSTGETVFWGFTVVIIRVPELFETSVQMLGQFGYDYRLSRTELPISTEYVPVYGTISGSAKPVVHEFSAGGCSWRLEVVPTEGWDRGSHCTAIAVFGAVIVVFATVLTHVMLVFRDHKKKYKQLATVDALTGLLNRHGFEAQAEKYMEECPGEGCVGMLLDVDNFKFVNDVYGHSVGDAALKQLAQSLGETFSENSIIGRNGGDEFCVILKKQAVAEIEDKIRQFTAARRTFVCDGQEHVFTISLGYAELAAGEKGSYSTLLSKADMALYEAKLHGKNTCLMYNEDFHVKERTQLGFALTDVSQHLPGAFLIYKADRTDDTILFANDEMVRLAGCRDLDDFMSFTGRRFCSLIRPDERESVERSIWQQINSHSDGSNDYVRFHFAMKGGSYRDVLDHGRIVDSTYYGRVFYVLIMDSAFIKSHYES